MTTQQPNGYDPHKDLDNATRIYMEHQRVHLEKLSWSSLQALIDTWIDTFFERQKIFIDKNEFHIELETVIEEYTGYFESSGDNILNKTTRKRMGDIASAYHELIYDGEIDPYKDMDAGKWEWIIDQIWAKKEANRILNRKE